MLDIFPSGGAADGACDEFSVWSSLRRGAYRLMDN